MILDFSCEAALIHASRRLWCTLPAYIPYTKTLALKALLQLEDWPNPPTADAQSGFDIAALHRSLDPDTHCHLRRAVFSSGWFKERHLNWVHRTLLHWTILQSCSWFGDNAPSRYQRQRIKSFVERQSAPASSAVLYLRIPNGDRKVRVLSAKQLEVNFSGGAFFHPLSFQVLDFGGVVPDELLRLPITVSKTTIIRHICTSTESTNGRKSLRCNRTLLRRATLDSIIFHNKDNFRGLMFLEHRSRDAGALGTNVLDLFSIKQAVIHGRSEMLVRILKQMWSITPLVAITDNDLISIMNEAGAHKYPEFQNTTRVLAMEVAARWKMTELEQTGQHVKRVPQDWPPRLIYYTDGGAPSQVWFIPRDSHHDVDWDDSFDVPCLLYCSAPSAYRFSSHVGC